MKLLIAVILLFIIKLLAAQKGSKVGREEEVVVRKIYEELNGINRKLSKIQDQVDGLEQRFNKTQEPTTTPTTPMSPWRQKQMFLASLSTATKSPLESCTEKGNFACYNDSSICVPTSKLCDKTVDCPDESDEFFCSKNGPEQIISCPRECPHGYYGSKALQKCYYFNSPRAIGATWLDALVDCTKRSANMVAVESRLEQEAIGRFLKSSKEFVNASVWLGATKILRVSSTLYYFTSPSVDSQWKWLANSRFFNESYTNWKQQPDNTMNNELCLEMRSDGDWRWNGKDCNAANGYICEIPMPTKQRTFIIETANNYDGKQAA